MNTLDDSMSIAPPGSSLYYSLLKIPTEQRQAIVALWGLCQSIQSIVDKVQEESVARSKLQWWEEELSRTYQGQPQHPATKALYPAIATYQLPKQLFDELLLGETLKLEVDHCCNEQDFLLYCYRQAGIRTLLTTYLTGTTSPTLMQFAHEMGVTFAIIDHIETLRFAIQRGRVYFPLEDFAAFHIEPKSLSTLQQTPALQQFLTAQAAKARLHYAKALEILPKADYVAQRHLLTYGKLMVELLLLLEKDGFHVLQYRLQLTPLKKFWLARRGIK